ncbi:hypothetical protein J4209_04370 [Candidatus Woesearchaeota archaeon]|nr:hypothetical protein [Candidatus Woesearchaeota archaeon]
MEDIMELGGNIILEGFSSLDNIQMIVIKKIVGNYAKAIAEEKKKSYEKLIVTMNKEGESFKINVALKEAGNEGKAEAADKNLFMAVDNAFKNLIEKLS